MRFRHLLSPGLATAVIAVLLAPVGAAEADPDHPAMPEPPTRASALGSGGAVASVDGYATEIGLRVLQDGGNAVDAAIATAAALGVTDPFSAGVGGGSFLLYYDAASKQVSTIDGRETAPSSVGQDLFRDATGVPYSFEEAVTSGLSVGVPGTAMTWDRALARWGTWDLAQALRPAEKLARVGFEVDQAFHDQVADNAGRFAAFPATSKLYLPSGSPPAVGSVQHNPDLAGTYRMLGKQGIDPFYNGKLAERIVDTVRHPQADSVAGNPVRPGELSSLDMANYRTRFPGPTRVGYRDMDVFGMAPPSSGGSTVGEALNILEGSDLGEMTQSQYLHRFLEASKIAFADRNRWAGDPTAVDVPLAGLLDQRYADSRACLIKPDAVLAAPAAPGDPRSPASGDCDAAGTPAPTTREGPNTTHLTVADRWGNVVSYTLTIEQTGGSGMVVPGSGFLLNNELTDFDFAPVTSGVPDPNLPGPGKRPRSSMAPTIVLSDGAPVMALGTPGGTTIITTVLQILTERMDRGMSLPEAIAAPRATQRNTKATTAEPGFLQQPAAEKLRTLGHAFTETAEIGAATGIEVLPDGQLRAAAEPVRRGGGAAGVVTPATENGA